MNNSQRVAVSVKDSTAKLIMGLLVDVGLPFEYRKAPGQTMAAVVSVAERNGPTLLKVREVIEDRQSRAQVRSHTPFEQGFKYQGPTADFARTGSQIIKETSTGFASRGPQLPPGYTLRPFGDSAWMWVLDSKGATGGPYANKTKAASRAWAHHFTPVAE